MSQNFHESFSGGEVKLPSERSTGLIFAVVALVVAVAWRNSPTVLWSAVGVSAVLAAISLLVPVLLRPLNIVWFKFGLLLHKVVNPIVMFAIFALVFIPGGALMRLWHDPLRLKRARDASTYWIAHKKNEDTPASMKNQF